MGKNDAKKVKKKSKDNLSRVYLRACMGRVGFLPHRISKEISDTVGFLCPTRSGGGGRWVGPKMSSSNLGKLLS